MDSRAVIEHSHVSIFTAPGRDHPSRLMLVLALSVGLPGLVLASFAFRSVRLEAVVEQADFQQRCESVAEQLYSETQERFEQREQDGGAAVDQAGDQWTARPGEAVDQTLDQVDAVKGVLVLDEDGNLLYPPDRARALTVEAERPVFAEDLRSMMGRLFQQAEQAELIDGAPARAAGLYQAALPGIPGYRGQLIARNARARCLYQAGRSEEALATYVRLAAEAEGQQDLNGFPLDLLAAYQVSQCQLALGDRASAARSLRALHDLLAQRPWGFGGTAEALLADRVVDQLSDPSLRGLLQDDDRGPLRTDLFERRAADQAEEAMVLALVPELSIGSPQTTADARRFIYERRLRGRRAFLFARTSWRGPAGQRNIVFHLDEEAMLGGVVQRLDGIRQANPELWIDLGEVGGGPSPLAAPAEGLVYQLEPYVPGRTIVLGRGDPTRVSAMLSRSRNLRLLMLVTFSIFIIVGLFIAYRAVRREFEVARMRTDFVSNVSHELRTPLATIRIMAEMLSMGVVPPGAKQQEYHTTILSETERLTRLIDNVLDFARIEQGRKKYRFESGDILSVVAEVQRATQDYLGSLNFELQVQAQSGLPAVRHDRDALVQALINLISNAIQYTDSDDPERRKITLSVFHQRDKVVLTVRDRGTGIPASERAKVFEKFHRGGNYLTRTVRGTGLGLSIVQHIADAHGGAVGLESEPGVGSTFSLVLPADTDVPTW